MVNCYNYLSVFGKVNCGAYGLEVGTELGAELEQNRQNHGRPCNTVTVNYGETKTRQFKRRFITSRLLEPIGNIALAEH